MNQRIFLIPFLLATMAFSSGSASGSPEQTTKHQGAAPQTVKETRWYPDKITRAFARKKNLRDVEYIRVQGFSLGHYGDVAPDITDPKLMAGFLDALKNAEIDTPNPLPQDALLSLSDLFEVHFKDKSVWSFQTLLIVPKYCFGPPFQKALVELGKYRTAQFHAMLRERGPHLTKAFFYATDEPGTAGDVARDFHTPQELKALLAEFDALDENAFAYANADLDMEVRLFFDDGTTKSLDLILRNWSYAPQKQRKNWPPLIGAYLKEVKSKRNR